MKQTKQLKAKEPVRIRFKKLGNGNLSIYLDIYKEGKRAYEFLKLYLVPERTPADKEVNRQMMELANAIKIQKIIELQNDANGFSNSGLKQKARLIDYLQKLSDEKRQQANNTTKGAYQSYNSLIRHLKQYKGDRTTFKQVTKEYCTGFIEYLKTAQNTVYSKGASETYTSGLLSSGTQHGYVKLLSTVLNRAVKDGILQSSPFKRLKQNELPKRPDSNREYLTLDEVKQLIKTDCIKASVKSAFLFSCFTGLRFSDVKALKWGDIRIDNEGAGIIRFMQKKTGKHENLQVSNEALKFLPECGTARDHDIIFRLTSNGCINNALKIWVLAVGIKKRVTFHVARHTNATLLLSLGVPIETVSKLLGHADIQTTQIYAKVIDKNKRAAVSKLDGLTD
jgi:integrase